MINPLSRKDKRLSVFVVIIFITVGAKAYTVPALRESMLITVPGTYSSPVRSSAEAHALLQAADTPIVAPLRKWVGNTSRYVHTERNSDLVINIPDAASMKYKIIFFEGDHFLLEMPVPGESFLVMEKNNFRHAGLFRYELYKDDALIERNEFIIKKD